MLLIVLPFLGLTALQGYHALERSPGIALSQQLVAHSFEVILTAQSLRGALQDADRGQRGYLLTGEAVYLDPYTTAVRSAPGLHARLADLTAKEPDQHREITKLTPTIEEKLQELRQTIEAYQTSGATAATRIVKTNAGLDAMRTIERQIDTIVATESHYRSLRLAVLIAQERRLEKGEMMSAALVLFLMLCGLILAVLSFRKGRHLQREIERRADDAARSNEKLEERNLELARTGELAREAKEEARRAEQAKGRFLATASHDLRQPLQAVSLLNGSLRRMVKDPAIADALRQQDEAIGSISKLLNALLDISKLESGAITPQPRIFPVALEVNPCEACVCTDPALFEQTLRNLVSNAIKYTHSGSVRLHAVEDPPWVDIEVIDTGIGIAADQLELIGEEFYQVGVPSNSTREGYGLGLSIVRRIIKLLGLQLQVRSEAGRGSVFSVRLRKSAPAVADPLEPVK